MEQQNQYIVTEKAGVFVAGKRSPGTGEIMKLTKSQASYALISGELVKPEEAKELETQTKSKRKK